MTAALYARKSNEQTGVADEAKSVTRQVEHAKAYAVKKGWTVADEHVYVDDGVSGALFGDRRPGLARLLNALRPRPPFQVLVMSQDDRLGRQRIETEWTLKQLTDAGVRVFYYLDDREAKLDDTTGSFIEAVRLYASQMEREKTRQRTLDALRRRAARGMIATGRVFGYVLERGEARVDEAQAAVVVRVFEAIAAGCGFATVAKRFNAEGVPSPRPGRGWASSGVRAIVVRELYRGRLTWGRRHWIYVRGTKVRKTRPESEWIIREVPTLRIVSDDLWAAAHERLGRTRTAYSGVWKGKVLGRPESGLEGRYLLSGFVTCAPCRGGMHVGRWAHQPAYLCTAHRQRGATACGNALGAPLDELHEDVVGAIGRDVLAPDLVRDVLAQALELWNDDDGPRPRLEHEAARLETEIARYTHAISLGGHLPSLLEALSSRQARLEEVRRALAAGRPRYDARAVLPALREQLTDWQGLLAGEPAGARQVLRKVLEGRVALTPKIAPGARFYEWSAPATYGRLLAGVLGATACVSGTRYNAAECAARRS
jgi:site-specific DNA recombinase